MTQTTEKINKEMTNLQIGEDIKKPLSGSLMPLAKNLDKCDSVFQAVVHKELSPEVAQEAKELRLVYKNIRVEAEKVRKKQKEFYLLGGRAVDGIANIIKFSLSGKENKLKEIENYKEIEAEKEKSRLAQMRLSKVEARKTRHNNYFHFLKDDLSLIEEMTFSFEHYSKMTEKEFDFYLTTLDHRIEEGERAAREEAKRLEEEKARLASLEKENKALKETQKKLDAKIVDEKRIAKDAQGALEAEKEASRLAEEEAKRQELLKPEKEKLMAYILDIKGKRHVNFVDKNLDAILCKFENCIQSLCIDSIADINKL